MAWSTVVYDSVYVGGWVSLFDLGAHFAVRATCANVHTGMYNYIVHFGLVIRLVII